MNLRRLTLMGALALAPLLAGQVRAGSYTLSGDDVTIWNPAGQVRIEATTGTSVVVDVTAQGRDARSLEVSDENVGGHPALRVLYPTRKVVYPPMGRWSNTSTSLRSNGTWGGDSKSMDLFGMHRLTIKGSGSGTEAWTDLVVRVPRGRKVSVYTLAGAGEIHNVDGRILYDGGAGGVSVTDSRGSLKVDVGSGGVEVDGFDGDLYVDTGSGSVRVAGVSGPSVRLDTGSGGVTGDRITTDDLLVDTGSGSVEIAALDARHAKLDTGSGGVEVSLLSRTPDLDIDTGSGSVRVSLPQDFSARVHLETGSGGIRSELPVTVEEKDRGTLRGTIGGGAGRLHVDTGSGGVSLLALAAGAPSREKVKRAR